MPDDSLLGHPEHPHQRHDAHLHRRPRHHDWLTVVRLPAYAPDLNPAAGAWANMRNSLGNLGSCGSPHQLAAIMRDRLQRIQYRPALIDGFVAQAGLNLQPQPP